MKQRMNAKYGPFLKTEFDLDISSSEEEELEEDDDGEIID